MSARIRYANDHELSPVDLVLMRVRNLPIPIKEYIDKSELSFNPVFQRNNDVFKSRIK